MVALPLLLILHVSLHLPEIGALIVRGKVHHDLLVIACNLLLILLNATLNDDVHKLIDFPLAVNHCACFVFLENRIFENLPPLL